MSFVSIPMRQVCDFDIHKDSIFVRILNENGMMTCSVSHRHLFTIEISAASDRSGSDDTSFRIFQFQGNEPEVIVLFDIAKTFYYLLLSPHVVL